MSLNKSVFFSVLIYFGISMAPAEQPKTNTGDSKPRPDTLMPDYEIDPPANPPKP